MSTSKSTFKVISLVAFSKKFDSICLSPEYVNSKSGETFRKLLCFFPKEMKREPISVFFSKSLGQLSATEIEERKNELRVGFNKEKNRFYLMGESKSSFIKLSI